MNALRRLVSALRTSSAAASGEMGMSVAQLFALRTIGRQPGLSMGDLAAATLTTASAVSEVVSRLVARGLVRREPDAGDHRRVLLHLTWEGRTRCDGVEPTLPERLVAALASMDPEMRTSLANAMENWVAGAGLGGVAPTMFGEGARANDHHIETCIRQSALSGHSSHKAPKGITSVSLPVDFSSIVPSPTACPEQRNPGGTRRRPD
jgi:DNA-binding MarR family transcriptional regulator